MSNLTAFNYIQENSDATPGLFNRIFSQLSDNIGTDSSGVNISLSGMTLTVPSSTSDYLYLNDSLGQKSNYIIGSHVGGTADGLNIFDASGNTMIASFSKQSIRFWQNVVGPVFDIGGALTSTLNAATIGIASQSTESRIQAAILAAAAAGTARVYVPSSMYPYSTSSVSFIYTVQMVREGGDQSSYDVQAYGAAVGGVKETAPAVQQAVNAALSLDPPGIVNVSGLCLLRSSVTIDRLVDGVTSNTRFRIKADGIQSGFLVDTGGGMTMFTSSISSIGAPQSQCIHFDGVPFRSAFASNDAYVIDGVKFLRTLFTNCSFHRIKVLTSAYYIQSLYFDDCRVYGWLGTWLNSTGGGYDVKWNMMAAESGGCFINITNPAGANGLDPVAGCSLTNSLIESMTSHAVQFDRIAQLSIDNVYFEGNVGKDINLATTENLTGAAMNDMVKITGIFTSPTVANRADGTYYPIDWGLINNGFASGNRVYGSANLHKLRSGATVTIADDSGWTGLSSSSVSVASGISAGGALTVRSNTTLGGTLSVRMASSLYSGTQITKKITSSNWNAGAKAASLIELSGDGTTTDVQAISFSDQATGTGYFGWQNAASAANRYFYIAADETNQQWKFTQPGHLILSSGSVQAAGIWATSGLSVGNSTAGGSLIPAISSTSSLVAAFIVQGSASSFTRIAWAAVQPGDQILTTVKPDAAQSSMSSGLVPWSHCTIAGFIEMRLSNVSTLAQNQSQKTYFFTRISPF